MEQGLFRFYLHKTSQRVDFSKTPLQANFNQNRMQIDNFKMNFFLPNYFAGKNTNAKTIFSLTKETYSTELPAGSYIIDPNIYIEEFKRIGKNNFAELWEMSDDYLVEVEIFFDESKYALEKLLREHRESPANSFSKPLVSKALDQAKKVEIEEDLEYDNQERYNEKRLQLLNKYSGALVGHGGYLIFDEDEEKRIKKENQMKKINSKNLNIQADLKPNSIEERKRLQTPQNKKVNNDQDLPIKHTTGILIEEQNPQIQIKNLKFLIIGIVVLILIGSGYFLSKVFLKVDTQSIEIPKAPREKKVQSQTTKKSKAKYSKKSKNPQQL